jgi:hypothetical protein
LLNKSNFAELNDQITHLLPDNADCSAKQKFKITNWPIPGHHWLPYHNRGSITSLDDEAIQARMSRQRLHHGEDLSAILILAITTVLVIKRVFRLTLLHRVLLIPFYTDECSVALPDWHQCPPARKVGATPFQNVHPR